MQGAILPGEGGWHYQLEAGALFSTEHPDDASILSGLSDLASAREIEDLTYPDFLARQSPLEAHLRSTGEWSDPHPWLTSLITASSVSELVGSILDDLPPADLGRYGRVVLYPIRTDRVTSPMLRVPDGEIAYLFNVLRFPTADLEVVDRLVASNRVLYERICRSGGKGYPVAAVELGHADWRTHFGPMWPTLADAKARFDPGNLLAPGHGIFPAACE